MSTSSTTSTETSLKLGIAVIFLILGLGSAIVPRFAMSSSQHIFSLGNMMASGVLLGAGLIHQLPEAQEKFQSIAYPWAGFICGITFAFFLIFEEIMHLFLDWDIQHNDEHDNDRQCVSGAHAAAHAVLHDNYETIEENKEFPTKGTRNGCQCPDHNHAHQHHQIHSSVEIEMNNVSEIKQQHHHHHDEHIEQHLHGSVISSIALMFALSIHSILAGFSLGLESSSSATSTAIAIFAHKMFEGYALGSTLMAASDSIRAVTYGIIISIFALSTPMGIVIAVFMEEMVSLNDIVVACLQAAVTGTFLYIAIIEVGMKELLVCRVQAGGSIFAVGKRLEMAKLASFLMGYGVMAILAIYV